MNDSTKELLKQDLNISSLDNGDLVSFINPPETDTVSRRGILNQVRDSVKNIDQNMAIPKYIDSIDARVLYSYIESATLPEAIPLDSMDDLDDAKAKMYELLKSGSVDFDQFQEGILNQAITISDPKTSVAEVKAELQKLEGDTLNLFLEAFGSPNEEEFAKSLIVANEHYNVIYFNMINDYSSLIFDSIKVAKEAKANDVQYQVSLYGNPSFGAYKENEGPSSILKYILKDVNKESPLPKQLGQFSRSAFDIATGVYNARLFEPKIELERFVANLKDGDVDKIINSEALDCFMELPKGQEKSFLLLGADYKIKLAGDPDFLQKMKSELIDSQVRTEIKDGLSTASSWSKSELQNVYKVDSFDELLDMLAYNNKKVDLPGTNETIKEYELLQKCIKVSSEFIPKIRNSRKDKENIEDFKNIAICKVEVGPILSFLLSKGVENVSTQLEELNKLEADWGLKASVVS